MFHKDFCKVIVSLIRLHLIVYKLNNKLLPSSGLFHLVKEEPEYLVPRINDKMSLMNWE